jgi:hypothetical protein
MTDTANTPKKRNRWLDWTPKASILATAPRTEPTKPTELDGSVGFVGSNKDIQQKISCLNGSGNAPLEISALASDASATCGSNKPIADHPVAVSLQTGKERSQWMRELSRRLEEIKQRRQANIPDANSD